MGTAAASCAAHLACFDPFDPNGSSISSHADMRPDAIVDIAGVNHLHLLLALRIAVRYIGIKDDHGFVGAEGPVALRIKADFFR